ncbi:hypothetical protein ABK905_00410 [Acerihabitans sp. KWT182]|uniref:Uncharacterized protein n=1 Tax=Acerihabitans sp. KWT182 TaxID=3157919 RepID=A0AAU7Q9W6_9GAMM
MLNWGECRSAGFGIGIGIGFGFGFGDIATPRMPHYQYHCGIAEDRIV